MLITYDYFAVIMDEWVETRPAFRALNSSEADIRLTQIHNLRNRLPSIDIGDALRELHNLEKEHAELVQKRDAMRKQLEERFKEAWLAAGLTVPVNPGLTLEGALLKTSFDESGLVETTISAVPLRRVSKDPLTYEAAWYDRSGGEYDHVAQSWLRHRLFDLTNLEDWTIEIRHTGNGHYSALCRAGFHRQEESK